MKTTTKIIMAALAVGAAVTPIVCKKLHNNKLARIKAAEESMQFTDEEAEAIDAAVRKCHCIGDGAYDPCPVEDDDVEIVYATKDYSEPIAPEDDSTAITISFDGKEFKDSEGNPLDKEAFNKLFEEGSCVELDLTEALDEFDMDIEDVMMGFVTHEDESSNDFHSLFMNYFNSLKETDNNEDQKNN